MPEIHVQKHQPSLFIYKTKSINHTSVIIYEAHFSKDQVSKEQLFGMVRKYGTPEREIKDLSSVGRGKLLSDEIDCNSRSHNLMLPSAEHVAKETPPEQPLAAHALEGSCMFSHEKFLMSHMQALCETSTEHLVAWKVYHHDFQSYICDMVRKVEFKHKNR